jgi:hypothetical protein
MQAANKPAWACISAPGMRNLQVPRNIHTVIFGADADDAGEQAVRAAALRLMHEGHRVKIARPPTPGQDFNDMVVRAA